MRKKISYIFIIIGIILIFYPIIGKIISKINQNYVIDKYIENIIQMDDEEMKDLKKKYELSGINCNGEMLGYIEINKINVRLPIYEGTADKVLLKGIGHIENSDLPKKNYKYHCILFKRLHACNIIAKMVALAVCHYKLQ